jgi:hypothetical protein
VLLFLCCTMMKKNESSLVKEDEEQNPKQIQSSPSSISIPKPHRVNSISSRDDEMIHLNVGGHLFTTTRDTLLKGDTMLSKMFSGQFISSCCIDSDGNPFIDRDGTHFRLILNYLRSGKFVFPSDPVTLREVLIEADFYQITKLSEHIEKRLQSETKVQYCKVLCNGDWIGQLNYLVEKGWEIFKFMTETESKYRELDEYGKPLKNGIGWYDLQTQCILLRKPIEK